jgi:phage terminase large subunit-like protein
MWLSHKESLMVGIEKIMTQVAVYQLLLDWKSGKIELDVDGSDRNIPILAIGPQGSISSMQRKGSDKIARFQIHEPAFERGEIHLRPEMKKLREQILFLGTDLLDHDDRVDSLVFALDLSYQGAESQMFTQEAVPMITAGIRTMKF